MVMDDTSRNFDVLSRRLLAIEQRLDDIDKRLKTHLGTQAGAATSNVPHPTMSAFSRGKYTVTNGTVDRTYNADTVVVAELADIVYTLIEDLKAVRMLQ